MAPIRGFLGPVILLRVRAHLRRGARAYERRDRGLLAAAVCLDPFEKRRVLARRPTADRCAGWVQEPETVVVHIVVAAAAEVVVAAAAVVAEVVVVVVHLDHVVAPVLSGPRQRDSGLA